MEQEIASVTKFVLLPNMWISFSDQDNCCANKCVNNWLPCQSGRGFVFVKDMVIQYHPSPYKNNAIRIFAEKSFSGGILKFCRSLFFFEVKIISLNKETCYAPCTFEMGLSGKEEFGEVEINEQIHLFVTDANYPDEPSCNISYNLDEVDLEGLNFEIGDHFGCGMIYFPNSSPIVFFTKNYEIIGTKVYTGEIKLKPFISLKSVSVETNFGAEFNKNFLFNILHLVSNYEEFRTQLNG